VGQLDVSRELRALDQDSGDRRTHGAEPEDGDAKRGSCHVSTVYKLYTTARLCWGAPAGITHTQRPVPFKTSLGKTTNTSEFRGEAAVD
jgi:hypothetical protein